MALQLVVDSLDSVPEPLRGDYAAQEGGKFRLNVDGLQDNGALLKALRTERESVSKLKADAAPWKKLGKTPDEVAAILAAGDAREAETAALAERAGNVDAILKQHQETWTQKEKLLTGELNAARASERTAIIETTVTAALTAAKATPEGLDLLTDRLGKRLRLETVDGKRKIQILQADGETPMAGKGPGGVATLNDLVQEAMKTWPSLFIGSGAGGGGKSSRESKSAPSRTITRAEFDTLSPRAQADKMKAGIKLID
jgi:hypothetical protein